MSVSSPRVSKDAIADLRMRIADCEKRKAFPIPIAQSEIRNPKSAIEDALPHGRASDTKWAEMARPTGR